MTDVTYMLTGFEAFLERRRVTFLEPLPAVRVCSFCGLVPTSTALLPCCHVVCDGPCRCHVDADKRCPVDFWPVTASLVVPFRFEQSELDQLLVRCPNGANCSFTCKLSELREHVLACTGDGVQCSKCKAVVRRDAGVVGTCVGVIREFARIKQDLEKPRERVSEEDCLCAAVANGVNSLTELAVELEAQLTDVARAKADFKNPPPASALSVHGPCRTATIPGADGVSPEDARSVYGVTDVTERPRRWCAMHPTTAGTSGARKRRRGTAERRSRTISSSSTSGSGREAKRRYSKRQRLSSSSNTSASSSVHSNSSSNATTTTSDSGKNEKRRKSKRHRRSASSDTRPSCSLDERRLARKKRAERYVYPSSDGKRKSKKPRRKESSSRESKTQLRTRRRHTTSSDTSSHGSKVSRKRANKTSPHRTGNALKARKKSQGPNLDTDSNLQLDVAACQQRGPIRRQSRAASAGKKSSSEEKPGGRKKTSSGAVDKATDPSTDPSGVETGMSGVAAVQGQGPEATSNEERPTWHEKRDGQVTDSTTTDLLITSLQRPSDSVSKEDASKEEPAEDNSNVEDHSEGESGEDQQAPPDVPPMEGMPPPSDLAALLDYFTDLLLQALVEILLEVLLEDLPEHMQ